MLLVTGFGTICNPKFGYFSVGVKNWDNSQQICKLDSFLHDDFILEQAITIILVILINVLIVLNITKTEKGKKLARQQSLQGSDRTQDTMGNNNDQSNEGY
jgi:hypothetical protein